MKSQARNMHTYPFGHLVPEAMMVSTWYMHFQYVRRTAFEH